ncbi:MAG: class I tRNA ligase family protein, partial [Candidatus Bathyarchaeia archaeon]
ENEAVNWVPVWAGSSRFKDWLVNADDWCISRSRIWGSPLNVWVCKDCGDKQVVGTIEELKAMARSLPERLELHRPWVDRVILTCPSCGGDMRRVEYVLDCWLDSGAAHTAAVDFLRDRTLFDRLYPYDYVTEAVDQTRGWFYSLIFTGVAAFDRSPYRNVLCQGHILDQYGQKMSKSRGNVVWAQDAMQRVGTDPLRVYMLWKAQPWDSLAFDQDEIDQVKRWLSILWNVFAFATVYMDMDGFDPERWNPRNLRKHLRAEDRWLLSRTQSLIEEVTKNTEALLLHRPIRSILNFTTEDLSRFYIRLIRRRTWIEKEDPDKRAAYATLYKTLTTVLKLLAPFAPYITEELYQQLTDGEPEALESVHMCEWPEPEEEWVDKELESQMEVVESIITTSLKARQQARLKLRWPVRVVYITPANKAVAKAVRAQERILLDQVNTKNLEVLRMGSVPRGVKTVAEIDYTKGGPMFKDRLLEVAEVLRVVDGGVVMRRLSEEGRFSLKLRDGTPVEITPDLLSFREELPSNLISADSPHGRVYVDTTRTPELDAEALAREVTRRAQVMRKEMDLKVEEYVDLVIQVQDEEAVELLSSMGEYITTEVRARNLSILKPGQNFKPTAGAFVKKWDVDGETIRIAINRYFD